MLGVTDAAVAPPPVTCYSGSSFQQLYVDVNNKHTMIDIAAPSRSDGRI